MKMSIEKDNVNLEKLVMMTAIIVPNQISGKQELFESVVIQFNIVYLIVVKN